MGLEFRYALLGFFTAYLLLAFVWRSVTVYRRTGINPVVLAKGDDAYAYVGRAFTLVVGGCAFAVAMIAFSPDPERWLGALGWAQRPALLWTGWAMLSGSLVWLLVAQIQMGASWRIGVDFQRRTELVQRGLFSLSRNPIFLGMRCNLLGFLFVFPSAATLTLAVAGEILIQIQVRLEEVHLAAVHGPVYTAYRSRVPRWL
jgi:protein-S-isoprenylcysteine O-methyltransferase Ste14